MFLEKLLNKIPFFRKRRVAKIKKELVEIRNDFAGGFFNDKYITSLHNIVNSSLIAFSDDIVKGTINEITTYTKSSMSAVKLLEKGLLKKSELERSPLLSTARQTGYFSDWYSNEQSVLELISILKPYLQLQVWLIQEPDFRQQEMIDDAITGLINLEIYDSLLYRYLLEDLVSIISFYIETQYE
ncbi:hypothetical protein PQD71_gp211 [Kosakonia phage Kc263]|uniref:Uncharacterized protein n=1 Tax=Kosakonia phage Kc263 TaxID=2863194 RepID=A0AAE7WFV9_9CAUD|nr:hypothetical protein PQD71_gp211 [Kosakonia phage Kc263]QYN80115.1 hypothetical protein [Kosakonia phage Kc263]